jgi:ferritin-like metal-binding protein YciE
MQGLIEEGDEAAKEDYEDDTQDTVVIGAAQRVEQYAHALIKTHWSHHRLGQISLGSFPGNYR